SVVAGLDVTDVALNGRGRAVEAFAVLGLRGREPRAAARVLGRTLGRQLDDVDGATAFAALEGRGEPRQRFEGGDCKLRKLAGRKPVPERGENGCVRRCRPPVPFHTALAPIPPSAFLPYAAGISVELAGQPPS